MDDDVSLIDMVRDLQDAKMGDLGRLAYVMERIESGRTVYNSDEQYVREKFRQLREDITRESADAPQGVVEPPPPPHVPDKTRSRPSKIWYILPIIAAILGGIIVYIILRKRNRVMSYKALGLGVGLTVLMVGFSWIVNSFGDSVILAYINENTILGCLKTDC